MQLFYEISYEFTPFGYILDSTCSCMKDRIFDIQLMCAFCVLFHFTLYQVFHCAMNVTWNLSFAVIINLQLCYFCLNAY